MPDPSIGLIGAGAIGRPHAELIQASGLCRLAAIADPSDAGRDYAASIGAPWFADHRAMLDQARPDAVIIATPNDLHLSGALDVIERRLPMIVEKPVATTVAQGEAMAKAADDAGVAVLVGHHRRHNPIIGKARQIVADGTLGDLTSATVLYTFAKPAAYFDLAWRRAPGGGPVLINLIHEIDLIRFVCGEIASVQAVTSNARRGFEVEDTAAVLLRLVSGALVTLSLSDSVAAPWSWDLASGESTNYPAQPMPVPTHFLCGTLGSLTLPTLELWNYQGKLDWFAPISRSMVAVERSSPYLQQLRHFRAIICDGAAPLVSAADATRSLRATLAVHEVAKSGCVVELAP